MISDLTYPTSHSINAYIPKNYGEGKKYKHTLPSVADVCNDIINDDKFKFLFTKDLLRAYKQFSTDPGCWPLLVSIWEDKYYFERSMPFGCRLSSMYMGQIAGFIVKILANKGIKSYMYLDDLIVENRSLEEGKINLQKVNDLFKELGLQVAEEKTYGPATEVRWLGIDISIEKKQISIPDRKIQEIIRFINKILKKDSATKKQMQSLIGKLFFIARCIQPVKALASSTLRQMRKTKPPERVKISPEMRRDIAWTKQFMQTWNGTTIMHDKNRIKEIYVETQAQKCFCIDGKYYYTIELPNMATSQTELVQVLNVWLAMAVFALKYKGAVLKIITNSMKLPQIISNSNRRDPQLDEAVKEIWLHEAHNNVDIEFAYTTMLMPQMKEILDMHGSPDLPTAQNYIQVIIDSALINKILLFINRKRLQGSDEACRTAPRASKSRGHY